MTEILLEVQHLKKSFGNKVIHKDISFSLHKGECLGLLGGSGMGKSVILRALIGLETIDNGKIFYKGQEIQNFTEENWLTIREKISYVFQNGALFDSLTVRENLAYPLRERFLLSEEEITKKISDVLSQLGLENTESLFLQNCLEVCKNVSVFFEVLSFPQKSFFLTNLRQGLILLIPGTYRKLF